MAKRVRIFFINCPNLATDAATLLLLAQNKVQTVLQFEVYHYWISTLLRPASDKQSSSPSFRARQDLKAAPVFQKALPHKLWFEPVDEALKKHDSWLKNSGYNTFDCQDGPTLVVTETPLQGDYLSFSQRYLAVISIARWDKHYAPPSVLEFVMGNVQRIALRLCFGNAVGSHYPTRGCIWDFDVHQPDAKIGASLGWLCETCEQTLRKHISAPELSDIKRLISGEWIGAKETPGSVANSLASVYSFDLTRTKGLNPGFWSFLPQAVITELMKSGIEIGKWVLILLITVWIASHFPNIARFLTK